MTLVFHTHYYIIYPGGLDSLVPGFSGIFQRQLCSLHTNSWYSIHITISFTRGGWTV